MHIFKGDVQSSTFHIVSYQSLVKLQLLIVLAEHGLRGDRVFISGVRLIATGAACSLTCAAYKVILRIHGAVRASRLLTLTLIRKAPLRLILNILIRFKLVIEGLELLGLLRRVI